VILFVLGGTRSGKSEVAERLAAEVGEPVTFVATAEPGDPEFVARIAEHRRRRPVEWETIEGDADLIAIVERVRGTLLVDSLGPWVARAPDMRVDADGLVKALLSRDAPSVVVSEEVGLSVHPTTEAGRRFADALGSLNTAVADAADRALLVVSGRIVELRRPDDLAGSP
jgi:adenosyl cobinamide kinase/adenosyl cobinamide phosphate guanylyltransferase